MRRKINVTAGITIEHQEELLKKDPGSVNELLEAGNLFALANLMNIAKGGNEDADDFLTKLFFARPEYLKSQQPVVGMTLSIVSGVRYNNASLGSYDEIFEYIENPTLENAKALIKAHPEAYAGISSYHQDKFELFKFVISEGIEFANVKVCNGDELDFVMSSQDYLSYVNNSGSFRLNAALKNRLKATHPDFFAKVYPQDLVVEETRSRVSDELA